MSRIEAEALSPTETALLDMLLAVWNRTGIPGYDAQADTELEPVFVMLEYYRVMRK
jgi:hypothetical protein